MNRGGGGEAAGDGIQYVSRCSSSRCRMFSSSGNELRRVHVKQLQLQLQLHVQKILVSALSARDEHTLLARACILHQACAPASHTV
jgi:hypothetical protein